MAKQIIQNPLTAVQIKKVGDQLVKWFQQEVPPADYVELVKDSIKPIDVKYHLYKALVRTDVYIGGVKQHISNIRFKIDSDNNVLSNSLTFS